MELVKFLKDILNILKVNKIHAFSNNMDGTLIEEIEVLNRNDDLVLSFRF